MVKLFYNISLRNYYFVIISYDKSILNYYIKMGYLNTLLSSSKIVRNMTFIRSFYKTTSQHIFDLFTKYIVSMEI